MKKSAKQFSFKLLGIYICLVLVALFLIFPIFWFTLMSFKTEKDAVAIPPKFVFTPTINNYKGVFTGETVSTTRATTKVDFMQTFFNSLIVCSSAVAISLVIGVPAAYVLARFKFRAKEDLAFLVLTLWFAPGLSVSLPLYLIYRSIGLYDKLVGLIIIYQVIALPLIMWIVRGYFEDIPREVEESARIDGANLWTALTKISLPLAAPGIVTAAVLAFIFCWNNFVFGLILASSNSKTLTVGLLGFIGYERVLWAQMAAAGVLSMIPVLLFATLIQRHIVRGLSFGAVKS